MEEVECARAAKEALASEDAKMRGVVDRAKAEVRKEFEEKHRPQEMFDPWACGALKRVSADRGIMDDLDNDAPRVSRQRVATPAVNVTDPQDVFHECGLKKNLPTGLYAVDKLASNIVAKGDFKQQTWQSTANRVAHVDPGAEAQELVIAVVEAVRQ